MNAKVGKVFVNAIGLQLKNVKVAVRDYVFLVFLI